MSNYTKPEVAAARAICRLQADACNVDSEDLWKIYGDEFLSDAREVLDAASAALASATGEKQ
jgi:hypothetical protein